MILVWFWYQGDAGLVEWIWKCSFLCNAPIICILVWTYYVFVLPLMVEDYLCLSFFFHLCAWTRGLIEVRACIFPFFINLSIYKPIFMYLKRLGLLVKLGKFHNTIVQRITRFVTFYDFNYLLSYFDNCYGLNCISHTHTHTNMFKSYTLQMWPYLEIVFVDIIK